MSQAIAGGVLVLLTAMNPHFEPLKPFLGKTWRGVFPNSTPEKPVVDVSRYELALNGQAVRVLHSINDGDYGGEAVMVWDETKGSLVYYYFTTARFYTSGTLTPAPSGFDTHEVVIGPAGGITEVKATFRLEPDGRLHVKTQHLKNGAWTDARDMYYAEAPDAVVRFKE